MKKSVRRRLYSEQFKKEMVSLVTEHSYTIVQAAQVIDTSEKDLQQWVKQQAQQRNGECLDADERTELQRLRREIKALRIPNNLALVSSVHCFGQCVVIGISSFLMVA